MNPQNKPTSALRFGSTSSGNSSYSYSSSSDIYFDTDFLNEYYGGGQIKVKQEHNAVSKVIRDEAYCFNIPEFADKLVHATYIEANKLLTSKKEFINPVNFGACYENIFEESVLSTSENDSENDSTFWPKISAFNIKLGMEKVHEFVSKWERSKDWEFCVEFLGFECEDCSNIFIYQVEWSKPTITYPIPQATANVFFALDVYKMVPYNYTSQVEVTYIFEGSTLIHRPGKIDFQEKWIEDILQAKLQFFKTVPFSVPKGFCK